MSTLSENICFRGKRQTSGEDGVGQRASEDFLIVSYE